MTKEPPMDNELKPCEWCKCLNCDTCTDDSKNRMAVGKKLSPMNPQFRALFLEDCTFVCEVPDDVISMFEHRGVVYVATKNKGIYWIDGKNLRELEFKNEPAV